MTAASPTSRTSRYTLMSRALRPRRSTALRAPVARGAERLLPGKGVALSLWQERDLVACKPALREPEVEHVAVDLPAGADDAAHRDVEPRRASSDLDFLPVGKPVASLPQRVVEHD